MVTTRPYFPSKTVLNNYSMTDILTPRQQIFERTQFHQRHNSTAANAYSGGSAAVLTKSTDNASDLSRVDTNASSRAGKDKK